MNWDLLVAGKECPFDQPRVEPNNFWESIAQLEVSTLCLLKNQTYRGHCILIYDARHVVRLDQLTGPEWAKYAMDLHRCASVLMAVCEADHMNIEALGMVMPHLHWQLIPRYKEDPRWGGPIWTTTVEEFHNQAISDEERGNLIAEIRRRLDSSRGYD